MRQVCVGLIMLACVACSGNSKGNPDGGPKADARKNSPDGAPPGWTCNAFFYGDGQCDCGCGAEDVDCNGGGCSGVGCTPTDDVCVNCTDSGGTQFFCEKGWTCPAGAHGDGVCDCGCGLDDPDCDPIALGCKTAGCSAPFCQACHDSSGPIACVNNWTCDPFEYMDGAVCNCGCGTTDPDCTTGGCTTPNCTDAACEICTDTAGTQTVCVPGWDNTACPFYDYKDGDFCDCGCGAPDPDCGTAGCSAKGCFDAACQSNAGWTCNPFRYEDTVCDCGCGAVDPDCLVESAGCADPANCRASACAYCNDSPTAGSGPDTFCLAGWTCSSDMYGDGNCDCNCGAPDIDCFSDECAPDAGP